MALRVQGQKPFKVLPEVMGWKRVMDSTRTGQRHAGRSKFLVLEGDPQKGKTMFAQGLWGVENTSV
eukprot:6461681-Alexandrium_andersonii.AAC.1